MKVKLSLLFSVGSALVFLCSCELAPEYHTPEVEVPRAFKESAPRDKENANWRVASPSDDLPRGEWWRVYHDHALDELEPEISIANQTLAGAVAAIDRANAYAAQAEAGLFPAVGFDSKITSNKQSAHRPLRKADTAVTATSLAESALTDRPINEPDHFGDNVLRLQAAYEIDLWGRVRDAILSAHAEVEARAADLENVRLLLQAELARDYFALRELDGEARLLSETLKDYAQALALTQSRVAGQISPPSDAARARAQLEIVQSQLYDIRARRALLEHAIATLVGKPASLFSLSPNGNPIPPPVFPRSAPSTLIERRPDIAAAERRVAEANESIGVARAAFFPRFTINLSGGTQDTGLNLLSLKNSIWSVGPAVTLPIFDGGLRLAELSAANAAYLETVARYRQSVLRAIQEVEDQLSTQRWLRKETASVNALVDSDRQVLDASYALYRESTVSYLDVAVAQTSLLEARRTQIALKNRELQASVALIMALGGGW